MSASIPDCEICGENSFSDGDDGFFYCNTCGSRSNEVIEMGVNDEDLLNREGGIYANSQRRARSQVTQPEPVSQVKPENLDDAYHNDKEFDGVGPTGPSDFGSSQIPLTYTDYYSGVRVRYVRGLQVMIQLQCKALVEKFDVSPLIVGLVGPIWLRYLAREKVLADDWADEAIHESESQIQGEIDNVKLSGSSKREPHNLLGKRAVTIWHRSLSNAVPLHCSLAISFLACHIAREPILPTDILKWTVEGKLPYFAAFLEIEKQMGPASRACPISTSHMFRPMKPIKKLESLAVSIARKIGLELPAVNFRAIASRYLDQLSLPVEKILPRACQVYEWSMPSELYLSDTPSPSRICVMSILIVTIRILYELNGGKWEMALSSCVDEENESDFNGLKLLKILEEKYDELSDKYDFSKDLQSYLQYCKDVVFAGLEPSYEDHVEENIIEDFWDFYQSHKAEEVSDKKKVESRTPIGFHHEGSNTCESTQRQLKENLQENKEKAVRQLKENMQENRFCYIPPRQFVKEVEGYVRYARRKDGAYIYATHGDYYILLRSCAKVAQVDVRTMHCEVLSFERRLKMLEQRIDYCLHKRLPNDSCDFCREDSEEKSL